MKKYIIVQAGRFNAAAFPMWLAWKEVSRSGTVFMACEYIGTLPIEAIDLADFNFQSEQEYTAWLTDNKYLITYNDGVITAVAPSTGSTSIVATVDMARTMLEAIGIDCANLNQVKP